MWLADAVPIPKAYGAFKSEGSPLSDPLKQQQQQQQNSNGNESRERFCHRAQHFKYIQLLVVLKKLLKPLRGFIRVLRAHLPFHQTFIWMVEYHVEAHSPCCFYLERLKLWLLPLSACHALIQLLRSAYSSSFGHLCRVCVDSLFIVPLWKEVMGYNLHFFNPNIIEEATLRIAISIYFWMWFCCGTFLTYHLIRQFNSHIY